MTLNARKFHWLPACLLLFVFGHAQTAVVSFSSSVPSDSGKSFAISNDGNFLYSITLNTNTSNQIHTYTRNDQSGELTLLQSLAPVQFIPNRNPAFFPEEIIVSPDNKQVYVAAKFGDASDAGFPFADAVLHFDVQPDGTLAYQNRVLTTGSQSLVLAPSGFFIYAGSAGGNASISVVRRNTAGQLTATETITEDLNGNRLENTEALAVSPDGASLYAASLGNDGHIYTFIVNQSDGRITPQQSLVPATANSAFIQPGDEIIQSGAGGDLAVAPNGEFLYSTGGLNGTEAIRVFSRAADGRLTQGQGFRDSSLLGGPDQQVATSTNGKFLYVVGDRNRISAARIADADGSLTLLGEFNENLDDGTINDAVQLLPSPDGSHLYVLSETAIAVFDVRADISLVKTGSSIIDDSADPPAAEYSYTLAVTNNGPSDAQNIVVTDQLPAGLTLVSATVNTPIGNCSNEDNLINCRIEGIINGAGYNITLVTTAENDETIAANTASVSADQLDTDSTNNSDSVSVAPGGDSTIDEVDNSGGGSLPFGMFVLLSVAATRRARRHD